MGRVKLVLELAYLGSKYIGWQPQQGNKPDTEEVEEDAAESRSGPLQAVVENDGVTVGGETLKLPCIKFNKGRCSRGSGCRQAHICMLCWRAGKRLPHAQLNADCQQASFLAAAGLLSVQEVVDAAVRQAHASSSAFSRRLKGAPSGCVGSGRTDKGVNAEQMVAY
eukprot:4237752-Amphidinium_carterae.1